MVSLGEVVAAFEVAYPPSLAESWDAVGLVCGDPDAPVRRILYAVDPVAATVDEALAWDADLLVTHHPLFLRPVNGVGADTWKGRLVHRLIAGGCGLFVAHTNADRARPGVNDALAAAVGLDPSACDPIEGAAGSPLEVVTTYVPRADATRLVDALADAGAGRIGDYDRAAFRVDGVGQFRPLPGADPAIGTVGQVEQVEETLVQMVLAPRDRAAVVAALRATHPYEEPAFHLTPTAPLPSGLGIGRHGELAEPLPLREFAARVRDALPVGPEGVRVAGDADRVVSRVAVCGGAGDSLLDTVTALGVDAYVTADLRHHRAGDTGSAGGPALLDAGHFATEHPWLASAAEVVGGALAETYGSGLVEHRVSTTPTGPWTLLA